VYALRSLTWYAGNRNLKYSWMMTYYLQPIVGAGLATITYVVLRGGLVVVTTQASPDVVNPFGFAAFGALVGLFSAQAAEWLKRIFEQVFAPAMKGKDPAIEVRITDVKPEQAPVGTEVAITGIGLADTQRVTFGGVEATNLRKVSAGELRVIVPDGAVSGLVTVHTPAGTADSPRPFTVGEPAPPPAEGGDGDGGPDLGAEQPPEPDPDEHAEAGLSQLTAEEVEELDRRAAAEHGEPQAAEVDDEPVDEHEDALAPDDAEEEGDQEAQEEGRP
jgi:hypothetical protein